MDYNLHIGKTVTPLDGRNHHKLLPIAEEFSEISLNSYRILVEITYLQFLSQYKIIRQITLAEKKYLEELTELNEKNYEKIREFEKNTNHDVKALEEYLHQKLNNTSLRDLSPIIHFGLTSDDDNNIAYALMLKNTLNKTLLPILENILQKLKDFSLLYKNLPMLGKTHGQPAVGTTVGKEIFVYYQRLKEEITNLRQQKIKAKLTGNIGNFNAHQFIFPEIDWLKISREIVASFGLEPDLVTTQIEPYDSYLRVFQNLERINNLLLGLSVDCWLYISEGYFKQKVIKTEVGSTALPHKVNPIYFEGAEGGLGIANSLFEFYCRKLSYSRYQRDLSDSAVKRSFGIAISYSYLSYQSIIEALKRIEPDAEKLTEDLDSHWEILSEAIQNFLRVKGDSKAYDKTKEFFRGQKIDQKKYQQFIKSLKLKIFEEKKFLSLTPQNYIGYAEEIVDNV